MEKVNSDIKINLEVLRRFPSHRKPLLFITALRPESRVLLNGSDFTEEIRNSRLRLFKHYREPVFLLETGVGIPDGPEKMDHLLRQIRPGLIINYGICGALYPIIKLYDAYFITAVSSPENDPISIAAGIRNLLSPVFKHFSDGWLVTVKQPILNVRDRERLAEQSGCPLVDMEAYPIARLARKLSIPLLILKVVSDAADEKAVEQVQQNVLVWQEVLGKKLSRLLSIVSQTKIR